ncbi:hypothetical protein GCM10025867_50630 (plasmid) [Frondihabitans sucicola]|uniref:Uncharacterized protein n=1 Tax=Frondihabitans sucicola TaxID=1268041 RepID=A0ABM8GWM3_9MICO|nr:hypothetical protein [Frondihabitans sucicola]BDZ52822.1 hypothetical protein GCM10025867_50630 [Frondihabitans sucicola]
MKLSDITAGEVYAYSTKRDPWEWRTDSDAAFVLDASGDYSRSGGSGHHSGRITNFVGNSRSQRMVVIATPSGPHKVADHLKALAAIDLSSINDLRDNASILGDRFRVRAVRAQDIVATWEQFNAEWDVLEVSLRKKREDGDARAKALTEGRRKVEADLAAKGLTNASVDMQSGRVLVNLKQLQDLLAAQ